MNNMEPNTVSKKEVAAVVAEVANRFATSAGWDEREALKFAAHWFDAGEAAALLALLTSERIRCRRCSRCVPATKASGVNCWQCAVIERREIENEEGEMT